MRLRPQAGTTGPEQAWHEGNGHSHLKATLLGPSLRVPISDGKLVLGTWGQNFHLEWAVRGQEHTIAGNRDRRRETVHPDLAGKCEQSIFS